MDRHAWGINGLVAKCPKLIFKNCASAQRNDLEKSRNDLKYSFLRSLEGPEQFLENIKISTFLTFLTLKMIENVPGRVSQKSTYGISDLIEIKYIKNDHWRVSGMSLTVDIITSKIDSRTICHSYCAWWVGGNTVAEQFLQKLRGSATKWLWKDIKLS